MKMADIGWIRRSPDELAAAVGHALKIKRSALDDIIAVAPSARTFANTIAALERADGTMADIQQQIDLLISVHPDTGIREAAQKAAHRIDEENVKMAYDRRLWQAVQDWEKIKEPLDAVDRKLADDTILDMKRMGFALPDAGFERLKNSVTELQQLETSFETAINEWEDHILVTREQLAGLPERYIDGLKKSGEKFIVSLQYPDYFPFIQQSEDSQARRELAAKNLRKGGPENLERLAAMITVRNRIAQLLGYRSHADYACEDRMAKNAETVEQFLNGIIVKLTPAARRELVELIDIKKKTLGLEKRSPIHFHEIAYWSHRLLKERFDIDHEQVKEYFPLEAVMQGMLGVYQDVLGVQFSPVTTAGLWHEDARLYVVRDGATVLGHFILDLYPRKAKYGHAATFPLILGRTEADGSVTTGLLALVCNFPKPTAAHPSLLSHDEVEVLFHEFGHVCHALLSGGRWQSQNGFGVSLDFVETPSQIFEEWAWETKVLKRISKHYHSSDPMPDELIKKLHAARRHMQASFYLRQAVQALYDLHMHLLPLDAPVESAHLANMYREMRLKYEAIDLPDDAIMAAGWSHMGDYDAGYYSYLWSKVFALDMYTLFKKNPLDAGVGRRYRDTVLAPGSSKHETQLVQGFLQRAPSDAAFLEFVVS